MHDQYEIEVGDDVVAYAPDGTEIYRGPSHSAAVEAIRKHSGGRSTGEP